jgi:ABC-type uncharacterized transport system substrate-binding protein
MGNKAIGVLLVGLTLAFVHSAAAQQQAKVSKIGWLGAGSVSLPTGPRELFWREFRKLGYVEDKNIATEYRYSDNKLDRLPALADELVRLKVEILVAGGSNAALAARDATKTIPIVFLNVSDPVADGRVDSLARLGGNITGFTPLRAHISIVMTSKESRSSTKNVKVTWLASSQVALWQVASCRDANSSPRASRSKREENPRLYTGYLYAPLSDIVTPAIKPNVQIEQNSVSFD